MVLTLRQSTSEAGRVVLCHSWGEKEEGLPLDKDGRAFIDVLGGIGD